MNPFEKNMAILKQHSERAAALVRDADERGGAEIFGSVAGPPTLRVIGHQGKSLFLHSPIDPVAEAKKLVSSQPLYQEDATILFGFGLGYVAGEIVEKMPPGHDLFIVELRPDVFRYALWCRDLSEVLKNKNTRLCIGMGASEIIESLKEVRSKAFTGSVRKLTYSPAVALSPRRYDAIDMDIDYYISGLRSTVRSFVNQLNIRTRNVFRNLSVLIESSSVCELKGAFSGVPFIVVSGGPSLDKNIEELGSAKGRSVIISVDGALRPLLAKGIKPDIVVTLDASEKNAKKTLGLNPEVMQDVCLVFGPECNHKTISVFRGAKYFVGTGNSFCNWLAEKIGKLPVFSPMLNVGHLGFFLARYLGGNPIVLVGFDYAFTGERGHASGTSKTWEPDFTGGTFVEIKDIYGKKVKTIPGFVEMVNFLEQEITKTEAVCIDATEGGALIRGTKVMPLSSAMQKYLGSNFVNSKHFLRRRSPEDIAKSKRRVDEGVRWFLSQCEEVRSEIVKAERLIEKCVKELQRQGDNTGPLGDHFESIRKIRGLRKSIIRRRTFWNIMSDPLSELYIAESRRTYRKCKNAEGVHDDLEALEYFFREVKSGIDLIVGAHKSYGI